jgi:hypothetical protein
MEVSPMQTMIHAARTRAHLSRRERLAIARVHAFSRRTPSTLPGVPVVVLEEGERDLVARLVRLDRTAVSSTLLALAGIGAGPARRRAVLTELADTARAAQAEGAIGAPAGGSDCPAPAARPSRGRGDRGRRGGGEGMILRVRVPGALAYPVGDEIWQQPLAEVIAEQAAVIADDIGGDVLERPQRRDLILALIREMTVTLVSTGDRYRSPDGVLYSLVDEPDGLDTVGGTDSLAPVSASSPVVEEILRFEDLPPGSLASRRGWFAGATAPKARPSAITATRCCCARVIMGTLGLCHLGLRCVV